MSDLIFDNDPTKSPTYFARPDDILNVSPPAPNTIFYLNIIKPYNDTHSTVGPVPSFQHLLPTIENLVSNSPRGIDKLDELRTLEDVWGERTPNTAFLESGFDTFVVPGQRGLYTVLRIVREVNKEVYEELPSPVYTVIATGPLFRTQDMLATLSRPGTPGKLKGWAKNTRVVKSWVARKDAASMAKQTLAGMTEGKEGLSYTEQWSKGRGGGTLMAMKAGEEWVVRVVYEEEVHRRANEGYGWAGENLGWRF